MAYSRHVLFAALFMASSATADDFNEQVSSLLRGSSQVGLAGIPSQCQTGSGAVANCRGDGGSCTPYPFQPHTPGYQDEPSWMDGCGKFTTYAFVPYNEDSYQAYKAENGDDNWVVHGHDGAGAQATDCLGDWHYFEHFGQDIGSSTGGGCDMYAPYPGQDPLNQCYFSHPGKETNFEWYNCGWWRGYTGDNGDDSGLYNSWNDIGVDAAGAPATYDTAMDWLRNCYDTQGNNIDCSMNTMSGVKKGGEEPVAYFVGTTFPWICTETSGEDTLPWTGVDNSKCYCDNEPWGGRNSGSTEPNHNTEVLYCGKYENETGMWCDYIKLHPEFNGAAIEYHFWLGESSF